MKHRTSELDGMPLDAAVAKALGLKPIPGQPPGFFYWEERGIAASGWWTPSTDWSHGGPIILRERISIEFFEGSARWCAGYIFGPTPLVAAMRAFVASKFGDEVEL